MLLIRLHLCIHRVERGGNHVMHLEHIETSQLTSKSSDDEGREEIDDPLLCL